MTIIKFMLSAVIVGMVGIYLFSGLGVIALKIKATLVFAQIIGGLLFGIGWAAAGYCPGTSVGAAAEGRGHAIWVIIGMLLGAAAFAEIHPYLKNNILSRGNLGKVTMAEVLHINPWIFIGLFVLAAIAFFRWIEAKKL